MQTEEPKPNKCGIVFLCGNSEKDECVYYIPGKKGNVAEIIFCKHADEIFLVCTSSIARVNRIILEAQKMGVDMVKKGE
jgi:hypothetical protein